MMNLRSIGLALTLSVVTVSLVACDDGFSQEDAEARCAEEMKAYGDSGCMTTLVVQACVDSYMQCGEATQIANTCPLTYSCPDDSDDGEATGGGGGEGGASAD